MSRVAKQPVEFGKDINVSVQGNAVTVKGPKGALSMELNPEVQVETDDSSVRVIARSRSTFANAIAGTTRSLINNMVVGVSNGFEKKLELVGVGYRAQAQGRKVNLSLGFSHPVEYTVPDGITVETPTANEIIVSGIDRQAVGQVAAELRGYRPPEPYKGKGVRYANERIVMKEAKKK
ncbi:MAG TPA: 50S ribosomal protein L6 [Gammaproteobacteria bacterium]|nr:50S ribosomal protein L6 [Gammaproteobacteria bacterium]